MYYFNFLNQQMGGLILGFWLTFFQPRGTDYAHRIIACPPGFENLKASLISGCYQIESQQFMLKKNDIHTI